MKKIKKQIPIDESNFDKINSFISTEFSNNFNDKVNEILTSFFSIITYEKIGLLNLLSIDEASTLCDIMYVQKYNAQVSPKTFLLEHIKNAFILGNIKSSYNINKDLLIEKIKNISEHQCYIIIILACEYNMKKNDENEDENIKLLKNIFLIQ